MCRITIAKSIRHRISSASLFKGLSIIADFFDKQATLPGCHLLEPQEKS
jgi:hypothetical protein